MHELMHGLGPQTIRVGGRETTVRQELKELNGPLEEAKADISGLWALQYLMDKGVIDKKQERSMYVTFLASTFRTLRFGLNAAHAKGMALQVNYLLDHGAVRVDKDGQFSLDLPKTKKAVAGLTHDIMTLQAHGDYAGVKKLLDRMVVIRPEVQRVIDQAHQRAGRHRAAVRDGAGVDARRVTAQAIQSRQDPMVQVRRQITHPTARRILVTPAAIRCRMSALRYVPRSEFMRPAVLLLLLASSAAIADTTTRYSISFQGRVSGAQTTTVANDGTLRVVFTYRDNGRGPDINETIRVAPDGSLREFRATGKSTFGAPISETFQRKGAARDLAFGVRSRRDAVGGSGRLHPGRQQLRDTGAHGARAAEGTDTQAARPSGRAARDREVD